MKSTLLAICIAMLTLTGCGGSDSPQTEMQDDQYGGMTLYTVRAQMQENPRETLQQVADIGYKNIEATGYSNGQFYDMEPAAFKSYLDSLGLVPVSSHQGGANRANIDSMITAVKDAGFEYFVIPVPPLNSFTYNNETQTMGMTNNLEELTQFLNFAGQKADSAGLKLLYHNHNFEFEENEDGVVPIEYFLENTDPELVNFQMDLYWVTKAGADPVAYFEEYPGRFKMWHLKDMDEQGRFAPVGLGTIDFRRILEHKEQSGMEYGIVEQDQTYDGMTPMEAITVSHDSLTAIGFE